MINRSTSDRRLLKLADFLERLPPERFNYDRWVDIDTWKGAPDLSCGTTACAFGWATTMPAFRRLGLRLRRTKTHEIEFLYRGLFCSPMEAAEQVFGLKNLEANWLFLPSFHIGSLGASPNPSATPMAVGQHIRRFVLLRQEGSIL